MIVTATQIAATTSAAHGNISSTPFFAGPKRLNHGTFLPDFM